MNSKCGYCSRVILTNSHCSNCGFPYCNSDCQTNDWGFHKKYCASKTLPEPFTTKDMKFSDFEVVKQIGEGNFTVIKKVEHKRTSKIFALKIIDKVKVTRLHKEGDVLAEKHSLMKLEDCHGVVKIFGTFKEDNLLYILQEYIPGTELWYHCQYFGLCSDLLCRYYMYQVLTAIAQMHALDIVHRDIKPENIMLTNGGNRVKFVDLGSSQDLAKPEVRPKITSKLKGRVYEHFVGTPQYMAPECANNKSSGKACDIWSAGCLLYQLYVGWTPFIGATEYLIFQKSLKGEFEFPDTVPSDIQKMIREMVQLDPTARPSIESLLKSSVFDSVKNRKIKPKLPLSDLALISIKDWYIKNAGVLRVRSENHEKARRDIDKLLEEVIKSSMMDEDQKNQVKRRLELFKKQLNSLLTDEEFTL